MRTHRVPLDAGDGRGSADPPARVTPSLAGGAPRPRPVAVPGPPDLSDTPERCRSAGTLPSSTTALNALRCRPLIPASQGLMRAGSGRRVRFPIVPVSWLLAGAIPPEEARVASRRSARGPAPRRRRRRTAHRASRRGSRPADQPPNATEQVWSAAVCPVSPSITSVDPEPEPAPAPEPDAGAVAEPVAVPSTGEVSAPVSGGAAPGAAVTVRSTPSRCPCSPRGW